MYAYAAFILFFVIVAGVWTVMIGNSKQNREGNPEYDKRTNGNMIRLTVLYVVATIAGIGLLIYFIN